jgi:hypothetical protein
MTALDVTLVAIYGAGWRIDSLRNGLLCYAPS